MAKVGRSGADAPSGQSPKGGAVPSPAEPTVPNAALEIRPDEDGEFDEIVARFADGMVHAEMMDDDCCYVGFYWDDGRYCQWWFGTERKGHKRRLWNNVEHGQMTPPRYTAQGVDTKPHLPDYGAIAASAGEAQSDATPQSGAAEGEHAVAESETPGDSHD